MKNKKAAMEMSVGTIVTIVLLMGVLVMGGFLIQKIFSSAKSAIDMTDEQLRNEMTKLFSEDNTKSVVIYPASREITIKKGENGGFGFSIRNNEPTSGVFSYTVDVDEASIPENCEMTKGEIEDLIILGKSGGEIELGSGDFMQYPIKVKMTIPDSASLCSVRYNLNVKKDGKPIPGVGTISIDLEIKSK